MHDDHELVAERVPMRIQEASIASGREESCEPRAIGAHKQDGILEECGSDLRKENLPSLELVALLGATSQGCSQESKGDTP